MSDILLQEFEMDPDIKRELLRQKEARIDLVKKEMAWEAAKHDLALRKLQSRLVGWFPAYKDDHAFSWGNNFWINVFYAGEVSMNVFNHVITGWLIAYA